MSVPHSAPAAAADIPPSAASLKAASQLAQSYEGSRTGGFLHEDGTTEMGARSHTDVLGGGREMRRSASSASVGASTSKRSSAAGGTIRKQRSLSRKSSLKRKSNRSLRAGSIGGVAFDETSGVDFNSVFYTPVPTTGSPTEILANRFQAWRKLLKNLTIYFKEVQGSYETRAKALHKVSNTIDGLTFPGIFMSEGGLNEANAILRDYHKRALAENDKAHHIETEVIGKLNSLRSDLAQKIKEIKSLAGDFKNSVEKEKDATKKAVDTLQSVLAHVDSNSNAPVGKDDPYIVRLSVDRQVERQIDEENYVHRAYLNLEASGRELEAIVVGEVQKAYNAMAIILKSEADEAYDAVERLRSGPLSLPKDAEWSQFIERDPNFVSPSIPLRKAENLEYPGKVHPAAAEVRAGMLERKSKYLKSYAPGWFVLSPTHLHEFKSADSLYTHAPLMSLYLPDQHLGAHSQPGSASHKFILKGRQAGGMHRGHSWVFRAESYDTMLAWYDDIKILTEKTGEDRNNFVRRHTRSYSRNSAVSTSDLEEDEADRVPYASATLAPAAASAAHGEVGEASSSRAQSPPVVQRPQPGGRFPSDLQLRSDTGLARRASPSSDEGERYREDLSSAEGGYQPAAIAMALAERGRRQNSPPRSERRDEEHLSTMDRFLAAQAQYPLDSSAYGHSAAHRIPTRSEEDSGGFLPTIAASPVVERGREYQTLDARSDLGTSPQLAMAVPASPDTLDGRLAPQLPPMKVTVESKFREELESPVGNGTADPGVVANSSSPRAKATSPELTRADTSNSISNLQLPGRYPKTNGT